MSAPLRIAVIGAGLIGLRHARLIAGFEGAALAAVVDPDPAARAGAEALGARVAASLDDLAPGAADAAIIATPNHLHRPAALDCLARGWPVLIEKPVAESAASAREIIAAGAQAGVPILVGHHRRHHPAAERARALIAEGAIGRLALVSAIWAMRKPPAYFKAGRWRSGAGGGPVLINLIHDVDLMRWICGDIVEITALAGAPLRGSAVEDVAAVALRFACGAVGTIALSDGALSPWSFEAASGENPTIAASGAHAWRIAGTRGALEFPTLRLWSDAAGGEGDWSRPLAARAIPVEAAAPLERQLAHFIAVARGETEPRVGGADALVSLVATEAILQAAHEGGKVLLAA